MSVENSPLRIGFTGHQRLTASTEILVRGAIDAYLNDLGAVRGICSLAEGSDQIFGSAVAQAGGDLVLVVPCDNYESTFASSHSLAEYQRLRGLADSVIELAHAEPSEEAYWDAGKRTVDEADCVLAVWDGKPAVGLGGTADVVAYARECGKGIKVIWPDGSVRA